MARGCSTWEPHTQTPRCCLTWPPPPQGRLRGLGTRALTDEEGSGSGHHISLQLPQDSGDRHKTAVGGIALSGREAVEAWPHSHWPWGRREVWGGGDKGLVASLHHSWQLCQ